MGESKKTLKVFIGKVLRAGSSGYLVPSRHPLDVNAAGALSPAPASPGVLIPYLHPAEVPVRDERHLALLLEDVVLKDAIVSDEKYAALVAREKGDAVAVSPPPEVADLRRQVAELQSDLEAAGAHYAALEVAAEAKARVCADAEDRVAGLTDELARVKARAEQAATASQDEIGTLRKQISELEAELGATRKQVEDLTKPPPPPAPVPPQQAPPAQAKPEDKSQQVKPKGK